MQAPLLPLLARKHALGDTAAFSRAVSRAVATAFAVGALLAGTWGALAEPIVKLTLQRSAFDAASAAAVSSLLMIYTVGAAAYMARDVLGRACYAMGEGAAPLAGSVMAVGVNAGLNWLLGVKAGWGAAGALACFALLRSFPLQKSCVCGCEVLKPQMCFPRQGSPQPPWPQMRCQPYRCWCGWRTGCPSYAGSQSYRPPQCAQLQERWRLACLLQASQRFTFTSESFSEAHPWAFGLWMR